MIHNSLKRHIIMVLEVIFHTYRYGWDQLAAFEKFVMQKIVL